MGIHAAERAEGNRQEISDIFNELNSQLKKETSGKIEIRITERSEPLNPFKLALLKERPMLYRTIEARNPQVTLSEKELAKWNQDSYGYPCKIQFGDQEIYCEDKAGLEEGLSTMLSDPIIGEILYKLMSLPPQEEQSVEIDAEDD